ncbi:MAG TPA: sulfurtransferase [Cyclobacteriaceae bacterium]|jgi:thiosulfate/3-mercaptopyruvate sulfurtransferase|nr:sulfurtransferase [Cyclobacteriaceae bacterium]
MKKLLVIPFVLFRIALLAQDNPVLVSPQWLHDHQSDKNLVIVQVNFLKIDYDDEHIVGARYLWPGWLAPDSPVGAMNDPDPVKAKEVLESLGISNDSHVVLCHVRGEVSPTARMFLTLENFGMKGHVSFLNGGVDAWKKAGYPVTKEVPIVKKGKFKVNKGSLIVDKNYVLKHLHSDSVTIVDARAKNFYDGQTTGNPRDGHIAGAKNIPYQEMVDASNVFKPDDQLQTYFNAVSGTKKPMVVYCFIGQTASVVYMAGRILGYPMALYDGSMQEWSRIKELPMEITEKKPSN